MSAQDILTQWVKDGKFTYEGVTYKRFSNDREAWQVLNSLMKGQNITVPICSYQDWTGGDLDGDIHEGFTVAPNGRQGYFMMIWHGWGNVTIFTYDDKDMRKRWIPGDSLITIYWL